MKPLSEGQSINIPMPRIQLPQDTGRQGLAVGTPLGDLVEKRDSDGLHSHNSLNGNNLGDGKQPRRRSISSEGMA